MGIDETRTRASHGRLRALGRGRGSRARLDAGRIPRPLREEPLQGHGGGDRASPFATALVEFVRSVGEWKGTASELLGKVNELVPEFEARGKLGRRRRRLPAAEFDVMRRRPAR